jgi:hypothetical protein
VRGRGRIGQRVHGVVQEVADDGQQFRLVNRRTFQPGLRSHLDLHVLFGGNSDLGQQQGCQFRRRSPSSSDLDALDNSET